MGVIERGFRRLVRLVGFGVNFLDGHLSKVNCLYSGNATADHLLLKHLLPPSSGKMVTNQENKERQEMQKVGGQEQTILFPFS